MISTKYFIIILATVVSISAAPVDEKKHEITTASTTLDSSNITSTTITTTTTSTTPTPASPSGSYENTTTFSCYNRPTGYYADVKLHCVIYHFCTQIEISSGESKYQRMSYVCMEGSFFDQKDLNCVMKKDLNVPCERAAEHYESSNKQFDKAEESPPSIGDSIAANLLMNPMSRFIAGR